jgi:cell shape-determining protein MreD
MKNLHPAVQAAIWFVLSFALIVGVNYVMDTFVRHQPFQPNWIMTAALAAAAAFGGTLGKSRQK